MHRTRTCDAYGIQLGLATLAGGDDLICHDACGSELFLLCSEAGLRIQLQPRHIFSRLIPAAILLRRGRPPGIQPDASIHVSLPPIRVRGQPRGDPLPLRCLLFDVKTIHMGNGHYTSTRARDEQSGAVNHREAAVWPAYLASARQLDRDHSPPGTTPIEQLLRSHTPTRGLIFGSYGEASDDVHALISITADLVAARMWGVAGARSQAEMRSILVSRGRRRVGVSVVQAMARHRLARAPYIGVPRQAIAMRRPRGAAAQQAHRAVLPDLSELSELMAGLAIGPTWRGDA